MVYIILHVEYNSHCAYAKMVIWEQLLWYIAFPIRSLLCKVPLVSENIVIHCSYSLHYISL